MKPIWYFVGLILLIMGLVLVAAGIFSPAPENKALNYDLNPNIWWGGLMAVIGLIYIFKNRKIKIE